MEKTVAMLGNGLFDSPDVDQIVAQSQDHFLCASSGRSLKLAPFTTFVSLLGLTSRIAHRPLRQAQGEVITKRLMLILSKHEIHHVRASSIRRRIVRMDCPVCSSTTGAPSATDGLELSAGRPR
jgi:hypothetical protein